MQPNNLKTNPFSKTAARQIISIQSASFGTWLLSEQTTKGAQQNWRTTCASENANLCTDFNVHSTQKSTCSASARPTFKMTGRPQIFGQTSIYTVHRNRFVLQARALPSKWPADPSQPVNCILSTNSNISTVRGNRFPSQVQQNQWIFKMRFETDPCQTNRRQIEILRKQVSKTGPFQKSCRRQI